MKKLLALLLAAVMCLSLAACGGGTPNTNDNSDTQQSEQSGGENINNSTEKAVIGAWKAEGSNDVFVFSDDGKVTSGDEEYDWWYDKEAERYCLSLLGLTFSFAIEEDETGRFFEIANICYYYVENYDPEAMKAEYIQEQIASVTEGKTELIVGNSYTSENGVSFTFDKAEITGEETDCKFNLYFTHEGRLDWGVTHYKSSTGNPHFGFGEVKDGSEGNTHHYAGGYMEMANLEKDREEYGFLCLTIDGAEYYVSINAFFE